MSKAIKRIISTSIIIVAIILLTIFMVVRTSAKTRENAISHMKSIAQEQTVMVRTYVDTAKHTLYAFSTGKEVQDLLLELKKEGGIDYKVNYGAPSNLRSIIYAKEELVPYLEEAQRYTSDFSATVEDPEGIWIGDWYTHCLTHTDFETVGLTTRPDDTKHDALIALQTAMENDPDGFYFYGVMDSPAKSTENLPSHQKQIVSMYKAVNVDGENIGFVGYGVYTKNLATALNKLEFNSKDTTFSMIDLHSGQEGTDRRYMFCDDLTMVGTAPTDADILETCAKYDGTSEDVTGSFEKNGQITFYSYMADMGWILFVNTPSSEVFAFSRSINLNMIIFCAICVALIIVFNIISMKQDKTMERLEQSRKKQVAITKNLHIAALKDILTDVNNRNKFIDDFSANDDGSFKIPDCPDTPFCFAMFNISGFSRINIANGHDVGDLVLVTTADILKERFGADNVYRTGSDEFVVAVQSPVSTVSAFLKDIHLTLAELQSPRRIGDGLLNIPYAASAVKKSSGISSAVLVTLKDLINVNGVSPEGNVVFVDMDNIQL